MSASPPPLILDAIEKTGATGYLNRMMLRTMDGVVVFDEVGRILWANGAFGRMVGEPAAALEGRSLLTLVREEERAGILPRWRRLVQGAEESYRVHLRGAGGRERLVMILQSRLSLGAGVHLAYVRDLTDSANLSQQLHELHGLAGIARAFASIADPRQMMDQLVQQLGHLIGVEKCYISLHDPVTDLVEPQAPAFGIAAADLARLRVRLAESGHLLAIVQSGQALISNAPHDDPLLDAGLVRELGIRSLLTAPLRSGQRTLGFVHVINRHGGVFHEDDVRPLQIFVGQAAVALENARLLQELAEEKGSALARAGQLEALVNSMADAVFIASADGRMVQINAAGLEMTGLHPDLTAEEIETYSSLLNMRHRDGRSLRRHEVALVRALCGETIRHEEIWLRPVSGATDLLVSVSGAPVRAADGSISLAVVVARDITQMRQLERHRDDFLSIASHELRTPLTLMRGHVQQVLRALERGGELDREKAVANLGRALRHVDRLTQLTHDLADVSRMGRGRLTLRPARYNLVTLVSEAVGYFAADPVAQHHIVRFIPPAEVVSGIWDGARLEQALLNLLDNAAKYSPSGGAIEVQIGSDDRHATISVRDEGIGIPEDQLPLLFAPFFRVQDDADRHARGLGLGLYIAHEIVRLHGGSIEIESTPGIGSLFRVVLPLESPPGVAS